jgi:hypothetical protein
MCTFQWNLLLFSLDFSQFVGMVLGEGGAQSRAAALAAKSKQHQAAVEALTDVGSKHPSRVLIERLIADATTWAIVHDEWGQV